MALARKETRRFFGMTTENKLTVDEMRKPSRKTMENLLKKLQDMDRQWGCIKFRQNEKCPAKKKNKSFDYTTWGGETLQELIEILRNFSINEDQGRYILETVNVLEDSIPEIDKIKVENIDKVYSVDTEFADLSYETDLEEIRKFEKEFEAGVSNPYFIGTQSEQAFAKGAASGALIKKCPKVICYFIGSFFNRKDGRALARVCKPAAKFAKKEQDETTKLSSSR